MAGCAVAHPARVFVSGVCPAARRMAAGALARIVIRRTAVFMTRGAFAHPARVLVGGV
jgi:hypothetical protein